MQSSSPGGDARRVHWEHVWARSGPSAVSWYQRLPAVSLELIGELGIPTGAAVLDVGGGTSGLVDALLARGFTDVTVLDIAAAALRTARERVGASNAAHWLVADVLAWEPDRGYDLWHDRAVFHFLTDADDRRRYLDILHAALRPGGAVVLGTFAADGPTTCSGLPVVRYSPEQLAEALGPELEVAATRREEHLTPSGAVQPFTWVAARHRGRATAAEAYAAERDSRGT